MFLSKKMDELYRLISEVENFIGESWSETELEELKRSISVIDSFYDQIVQNISELTKDTRLRVFYREGMILPFESREAAEAFVTKGGLSEHIDFEFVEDQLPIWVSSSGPYGRIDGTDSLLLTENHIPRFGWRPDPIGGFYIPPRDTKIHFYQWRDYYMTFASYRNRFYPDQNMVDCVRGRNYGRWYTEGYGTHNRSKSYAIYNNIDETPQERQYNDIPSSQYCTCALDRNRNYYDSDMFEVTWYMHVQSTNVYYSIVLPTFEEFSWGSSNQQPIQTVFNTVDCCLIKFLHDTYTH